MEMVEQLYVVVGIQRSPDDFSNQLNNIEILGVFTNRKRANLCISHYRYTDHVVIMYTSILDPTNHDIYHSFTEPDLLSNTV